MNMKDDQIAKKIARLESTMTAAVARVVVDREPTQDEWTSYCNRLMKSINIVVASMGLDAAEFDGRLALVLALLSSMHPEDAEAMSVIQCRLNVKLIDESGGVDVMIDRIKKGLNNSDE
jgi:hypothetical protein